MGGGPDLGEAAADAEALGLPAALVDSLRVKPREFEVWPVNLPVIDAWRAIASQWRTAPLADGRLHWLGLDYTAVQAGLALAGRAIDRATWAGVRVMEGAAAAVLNGGR
ncbi:DUF1799 domain-containing protein [Sphingomonas sp.]|uniref:DUF1799 domain-containing protein n=1 Tax=Sphingomonas sp. TaxID=28214 RepID=UPI003CC550D1